MARPDAFDLTAVSIPPEIYEAVELGTTTGEGVTGGLVLFAEEVSPP